MTPIKKRIQVPIRLHYDGGTPGFGQTSVDDWFRADKFRAQTLGRIPGQSGDLDVPGHENQISPHTTGQVPGGNDGV